MTMQKAGRIHSLVRMNEYTCCLEIKLSREAKIGLIFKRGEKIDKYENLE